MASTANVVCYLVENYPHPHELSKARVTKMVYLGDWFSAQQRGRQITNIEWFFHNFGPYVDDVVSESRRDPRLAVERTLNFYGDPKEQISFVGARGDRYDLKKSEVEILDEVISETKSLYWDSFISYVYKTYPIKVTNRYSPLNLVALAAQEKEHA